MRRIERSTAFRRDFKRLTSNPHHRNIGGLLYEVLTFLADDKPLPPKNRDHLLGGSWSGYRECHVKPDVLLIYRKSHEALQLARLGSHSELFGK